MGVISRLLDFVFLPKPATFFKVGKMFCGLADAFSLVMTRPM